MKTKIIKPISKLTFQIATTALTIGKVVAIPTDTVYGIAVKADRFKNVEKLYKIKSRERTKAIPVLLGEIDQLPQVTSDVSPELLKLAESFWPGALTIIVPKHPRLPDNISPYPTLGIRIPNHPITLKILKSVGPLAVTSANLSGESDSSTAEEVHSQLGGLIDLIIDGGKTKTGLPSTVIDLTGNKIKVLREGPISFENIQKVLSSN